MGEKHEDEKMYRDVGIRIRFLREDKQYTRDELAEMADIFHKFYI